MRIHRLISILMTIEKHSKIKAKEMAAVLEVSTRTIYRDIDVLCEAGYPIITTTGQTGGISFIEGYQLNLERVDPLLNTLMQNLYAVPGQQELINALEDTLKSQYKSIEKMACEEKRKLLIDKSTWWGDNQLEVNLELLIKAVFEQRKIKIGYQKIKGEGLQRTILPYGLVMKYTTWYLVGYCEMRSALRTFKCSEIHEILLSEEGFQIPCDFVLEEYWEQSIDRFKQERVAHESYLVEIKIKKSLGEILEHYSLVGLRQTKDFLVGIIDMHREDIAMDLIRSILCYGEILYPQRIRMKAQEILNESTQWYI